MARDKTIKSSKNMLIIIMAVVVALGMVLSTVIIYIDYLRNPKSDYVQDGAESQESIERQLKAEQDNLKQEIERLKEYIDEYGSSPAVLDQLASLYSGLAEYARWTDIETRPQYLEEAATIYLSLTEAEPQQVKYRFLLFSIYKDLGREEEAAEQAGQAKQLIEEKQTGEGLENTDRFYYAFILDEVDGNNEEALNQLVLILETESEESPLYAYAESYRKQLESREEPSAEGSSPGN